MQFCSSAVKAEVFQFMRSTTPVSSQIKFSEAAGSNTDLYPLLLHQLGRNNAIVRRFADSVRSTSQQSEGGNLTCFDEVKPTVHRNFHVIFEVLDFHGFVRSAKFF